MANRSRHNDDATLGSARTFDHNRSRYNDDRNVAVIGREQLAAATTCPAAHSASQGDRD